MKKISMLIWTIWNSFVILISPIWITMVYLCFSGKIYQVDATFDDGVAGIFGIVSFLVWLVIAFIPFILFFRMLKKRGTKFIWLGILVMLVLILICCALCNWNIIMFLSTTKGEL